MIWLILVGFSQAFSLSGQEFLKPAVEVSPAERSEPESVSRCLKHSSLSAPGCLPGHRLTGKKGLLLKVCEAHGSVKPAGIEKVLEGQHVFPERLEIRSCAASPHVLIRLLRHAPPEDPAAPKVGDFAVTACAYADVVAAVPVVEVVPELKDGPCKA